MSGGLLHDSSAAGLCTPQPLEQRALRLGHSMVYAVSGQFGYVLSQMIVLASLARVRGAEAVGEFGLALALTTPFFMFAGMGAKSGQASDVTQRYSFAEYAGLAVFGAVIAAIASIATGSLFVSGQGLLIVVIIALTKLFEAISNLAYGAFQQAGRVDQLAASLILRGACTVPLFLAMLLLGFSTPMAFIAQLIVWSMFGLLVDYPRASRMATGQLVMPSAKIARLTSLAREMAPLGASYLLNSLLISLPRLLVERILGLSAVGLLTVVNYFQQAGTLLANSVSQMLVNRFARLRHTNAEAQLRTVALVIFAMATVCSVAAVVVVYFAGEWILRSIFGPAFEAADDLLMLITLAVCAKLFSTVPQSLLHAERRFHFFLVREAAAVVVCLVLLVTLVPTVGLIGAGYAILGAALFRLGLMMANAGFRPPSSPGAVSLSREFDAAGAP